jgi:hypothetical protein
MGMMLVRLMFLALTLMFVCLDVYAWVSERNLIGEGRGYTFIKCYYGENIHHLFHLTSISFLLCGYLLFYLKNNILYISTSVLIYLFVPAVLC